MTTNDTRTPEERAEELATERYPLGSNVRDDSAQWAKRNHFNEGFLARDAEPTTVSAEQIAQVADAWWNELIGVARSVAHEHTRTAFRAAGFRIEGDPA